ncbi:hypothetical protein X805_16090 [Sphaerotilus natans subsp. natans DSM 6575]|uniref:FecR protein domain-containing protein n=2 Tax=Sphaerotilus natans TaxID=34103 RepID=A0A059KNC1_9BURK|nr:hypothetical protein X805_16090 [Sphaerotilus natans subsp. natans DSM 6575]
MENAMDRILHRSVPAALALGAALLLAQPAAAWQGTDELRIERRAPMREGERLRSAAGSRTEIAFGSDRLRLDENSVLSVRRLSAGRIELRLEQGSLALLLEGDDDPLRWRIETAAAMHRPQGPGLFRIDAPESGRWFDGASATAWRSPMHLESADDSLLLQPGRRAELEGRRGWQTGLPVADRFARWAMDDTRERWDGQDEDGRRSSLRPRAPVELPDDIDGVDTLDRHGRWEHASDWGWVWVPRASLSWAPYRQGRWRRSADGWLWIDSAPWGVATFRHGRWVRWDSHWAWLPGPALRHVEPVAPVWEAPPPRVIVQPAPVIIETRPARPIYPDTPVRPAPAPPVVRIVPAAPVAPVMPAPAPIIVRPAPQPTPQPIQPPAPAPIREAAPRPDRRIHENMMSPAAREASEELRRAQRQQ